MILMPKVHTQHQLAQVIIIIKYNCLKGILTTENVFIYGFKKANVDYIRVC